MMNRRTAKGVTLLEAIIAFTLLTVIALFTMRAVGQGRIVRGNARAQHELLLLAQEELERVRAIPATELQAGEAEHQDSSWPSTVTSKVLLEKQAGGTWLVDVTLFRETIEGLPPVRLTTIRRGGEQ